MTTASGNSSEQNTGNARPPVNSGGPSRLVQAIVSGPGFREGAPSTTPGNPEKPGSAPPPPSGRGASDLQKRLATAAVALPLIIGLMLVGGVWWMLLVVVVVGLGSVEFYLFMEAKGLVPHKALGTAAAIGLVIVAQGSNEYYVTLLLTCAILAILIRQLGQRDISTAISGMSVTIFGVIYVGWLGAHLVLVRNLGSEIAAKYMSRGGASFPGFNSKAAIPQGFEDIGLFFMLLAMASTFLADTGGYFVGRKFGKHKLAPTISPKKSWEGLGGSVLFAVAGALIVRTIFLAIYKGQPYQHDLGYAHCAILGVLAAFFGLAGDLVESMLKRDARVKDASGLLPGHGGFLDRLDSLNFTVPLTYYYIKIYYYLLLAKDVKGDWLRFLERYGLN